MIYKSMYFYDYEIFLRTPQDILCAASRIYLPYYAFCKNNVRKAIQSVKGSSAEYDIKFIAVLPYINKGNERKAFEQSFDTVCEIVDGFMLQNIGDKIMLDNLINARNENSSIVTDKILCGDYGLNVYNTETASFWGNQGLYSVTVSPEPSIKEQFKLAENICDATPQIIPEIVCFGRVIVMRSEHCFISQTEKFHCGKCGKNGFAGYSLTDNAGNTFPIVGLKCDCQNLILSAKPISSDIAIAKKSLCRSVILRYNVFNENDINELEKKGWLQL